MNISVPFDGPAPGRKQYSFTDIAIAHAMTGVPLSAFEQLSPTAYAVRGAWPKPPTTNSNFSSAVAASQAVPETASKSSVAARSIWPNLR
jgi:hypothetical protein